MPADLVALSKEMFKFDALGEVDLANAIRRLPYEQGDPLILWRSGMTYQAIANQKRWPLGTVRSRIGRARQKLAKMQAVNA